MYYSCYQGAKAQIPISMYFFTIHVTVLFFEVEAVEKVLFNR